MHLVSAWFWNKQKERSRWAWAVTAAANGLTRNRAKRKKSIDKQSPGSQLCFRGKWLSVLPESCFFDTFQKTPNSSLLGAVALWMGRWHLCRSLWVNNFSFFLPHVIAPPPRSQMFTMGYKQTSWGWKTFTALPEDTSAVSTKRLSSSSPLCLQRFSQDTLHSFKRNKLWDKNTWFNIKSSS